MPALSFFFVSKECLFQLISTTHPIEEMTLKIKRVRFLLELDLEEGTDTCTEYVCTVQPFHGELKVDDGYLYNETYSTAGFKLKLDRNSVKYILSYYIPSALFVASSWISFMIPPEVIPGRMALLITLILALVNLSGTVIDKRPSTKNPTVLDIWMLVCISFVWIALLAYAILLMGQRTRAWTNETNVVTLVTPNSGKTKVAENLNRRQFSSINLDKIYLISLPIIFCLFNLIYWPIIYP